MPTNNFEDIILLCKVSFFEYQINKHVPITGKKVLKEGWFIWSSFKMIKNIIKNKLYPRTNQWTRIGFINFRYGIERVNKNCER